VLRGASTHIVDEAERSLHDALCVLINTVKNTKVVYGGGNSEIQMSLAVDKLTSTVKGKQVIKCLINITSLKFIVFVIFFPKALAIEAYARALR